MNPSLFTPTPLVLQPYCETSKLRHVPWHILYLNQGQLCSQHSSIRGLVGCSLQDGPQCSPPPNIHIIFVIPFYIVPGLVYGTNWLWLNWWYVTSKIIKGCSCHFGLSFLDQLLWRKPAALVWGCLSSLWKGLHGEEMRCLTKLSLANKYMSELGSRFSSFMWLQPQLTTWLQPCKKSLIWTTLQTVPIPSSIPKNSEIIIVI